jgi:hypothetical protein
VDPPNHYCTDIHLALNTCHGLRHSLPYIRLKKRIRELFNFVFTGYINLFSLEIQ